MINYFWCGEFSEYRSEEVMLLLTLGRCSQKVTKLDTANFSLLFYGTPRVNTFIAV